MRLSSVRAGLHLPRVLIGLVVGLLLISLGSAPAQAIGDVNAPEIDLTPAWTDGWRASGITYQVRATDNKPGDTGVSTLTYELSGATTGSGSLNRVSGGPVTISAAGVTTLKVVATDNWGFVTTNSFTVRVDLADPTTSVTLAPGTVIPRGEFRFVSYSCADPGSGSSGIASCVGTIPSGSLLDTSTDGSYTFTVTAKDHAGRTTVTTIPYTVSGPTGVFQVTSEPRINGSGKVGTTLTASPTVTSPPATETSCSWGVSGWGPVGLGTEFVVEAKYLGGNVTYQCSSFREGYNTLTRSATAVPVQPGDLTADLVTNRGLTGTAAPGSTLTASYTIPNRPTGLQDDVLWLRDGTVITGATGNTYLLTAADLGHVVRAEVRLRRTGYNESRFTLGERDLNDTAGPTIDIGPQPTNQWRANAVSYRLTATDNGPLDTGVASFGYELSGATSGTGHLPLSGGGDVAISAEGTTRFQATATDIKGNTSRADFQVRIDLTDPSASLSGITNGGTYSQHQDVVVQYSCSDHQSGIETCAGDVPSGELIDTTTPGDHTFTVTATDRVGRTATRDVFYRVVADTHPPVVEVSPAPTDGWLRDAITYNLTATEGRAHDSGVSLFGYELTGAVEGHDDLNPIEGGQVTIDAEGVTHLRASAVDLADNVGTTEFDVRIDRTNPRAEITGLVDGAELARNQVVHVSYACADDQSGVDTCVGDVPDGGTLDTSTAGEHTFTVVATDRSGRTTTREVSYVVAPGQAQLQLVSPSEIVGSGRVGAELVGNAAVFEPVADVSCRWLRDGEGVDGGDGATYTPTVADLGATMTYDCVGRLATYDDMTSTSVGRVVVEGDLPDGLVSDASLAGDGVIGATLTASYTIADRPADLEDEVVWLRDGDVIDGATGNTYLVRPGDVDHTVRAVLDVTRPGYTDRRYPIGQVDVAVVPDELGPVVTADPEPSGGWSRNPVTHYLTARDDRANDTGVATFGYELTGATRLSGELDVTEGGAISIRNSGATQVLATATDNAGNTGTLSFTVQIDLTDPQVLTVGFVDGVRLRQGQEVVVSYDCSDSQSGIASCTGDVPAGGLLDTSTPGAHSLTATATDQSGRTRTRTFSYVVLDEFDVVTPPAITGVVRVGEQLAGVRPTFNPEPTRTECHWFRDGDLRHTGDTFTPTVEDLGAHLDFGCYGYRDDFLDKLAVSSPIQVQPGILAGDLVTQGRLDGRGRVGASLNASYSIVDRPVGLEEEVLWLRDDVQIDGAVGGTYTLQDADLGHTVRAVVEVRRPGYEDRRYPLGSVVVRPDSPDQLAPEITVDPNPNGQWRRDPVTYHVQATDDRPLDTGVESFTYRTTGASEGTGDLDPLDGGDITVDAEGLTRVQGDATDAAGNIAHLDFDVRVDLTDPELTLNGTSEGAEYQVGESVALDVACADDQSGIESCTWGDGNPEVLDTTTAGEHALTAAAVDRSGRTTTRTIHYRVYDGLQVLTPAEIVGDGRVGETLTGTPATFEPVADVTCRWLRDGEAVAVGATYALTIDDLGSTITFECVGAREGYDDETSTAVGRLVVPGQMADGLVSEAGLAGDGVVGATLTASYAIADRPGDLVAVVVWLRDGEVIAGAAGATYVVTAADAGRTVRAVLDVSRPGYTDRRYPLGSVAVAGEPGDVLAPVVTVAPDPIEGWLRVAPTYDLTARDDRAGDTGVESFGYELSGAESGSGDLDVVEGGEIAVDAEGVTRVVATATDAAGNEGEADFEVRLDLTDPEVDLSGVSDGGTYELNQVVRATYECADLPSGIESCVGDVPSGDRIDTATVGEHTFTVDATDASGRTTTHEVSYQVTGRIQVLTGPQVSGSGRVGEELVGTPATFDPAETVVGCQWFRDGAWVTEEGDHRYTPAAADLGHSLVYTCIGELEHYAGQVVDSETVVVEPGLLGDDLVSDASLNGIGQVGTRLTASYAITDRPADLQAEVVWLRDFDVIEDATGETYRLRPEDLDHTVRAVLVTSRPGYAERRFAVGQVDVFVPADELAPVVTVSPEPTDDWVRAAPTYRLSARDDRTLDTGVESFGYELSGASQGSGDLDVTEGGDVVVDAEGVTRVVATAVDGAGNEGGADFEVRLDLTDPAVDVTGLVEGAELALGQEVHVTYLCDDAQSGVASCEGDVASGGVVDTTNAGDHTFAVTATDNAGRTTTREIGYTVVDDTEDRLQVVTESVISGGGQVGEVLTGTPAVFDPAAAEVSCGWLRDGEPIAGATGVTYELTAADLGATVVFECTGVLEGYADATSTSVGRVVVAGDLADGLVSEAGLAGDGVVGATLTASYAIADRPGDLDAVVVWLRDGEVIAGAAGATYVVTAADAGRTVRAVLDVSRPGYTDRRYPLGSVAVAEEQPDVLQVVSESVISGGGQVGEVLTGTPAVFDPAAAEVSCGWLRDGEPIAGATGVTYELTAADLGATVVFECTGVLEGYADATSTSVGRVVVAGDLADGLVSEAGLAGDGVVGATLTASYAIADRPGDLVAVVVWLRDGEVIAGAAGATYVVTAADAGRTVRAVLDVSRPGYTDRRYPLGSVAVAGEPGDVLAPVVTVAPDPIEGWLRVAPTYDLTARDDRAGDTGVESFGYELSGAESGSGDLDVVEGGEIAVDAEGVTRVVATATDAAGNEGEADFEVRLDLTDPEVTIDGISEGAELALDEPVEVSYACADGQSGIDTCVSDLPQDGVLDTSTVGDFAYTATATDNAGRVTTRTVHYTVVEASGEQLRALTRSRVSGSGRVGDELVGTPATYAPEVDRTACWWQRDGVAVTRVGVLRYTPAEAEVGASLVFRCVGILEGYANLTSRSLGVTVLPADAPADQLAPVVTVAPEPTAGWRRAATSYHLRATDVRPDDTGVTLFTYALSGATEGTGHVDLVDGEDVEIANEGVTRVQATATDRAGNEAGADFEVRLDLTDPAVDVTGLVQGAELALGQEVHVSYVCDDAVSGVASCEGDVASGEAIDTATEGAHAFAVRATDNAGRTTTRQIGYTVVDATEDRLQVVTASQIVGTGRVGETLTGTPAVFEPTAEVTCEWLRDGVVVGTGATYELTATDLGSTITFECVGTREGYADETSTSVGRIVVAGDLADGLVTEADLDGVAEIGSTLTASYTIADRPADLTDAVVWLRDGEIIAGATGTTYVVTAADAEHTLRAVVDVTRPGYTDRRYPIGERKLFDDLAPVLTIAPEPADGWLQGPVTYHVSATDDRPWDTGLAAFSYQLTGATEASGNLDRSDGEDVTVANEGVTRFRVSAADGKDHTTEADFEVRIDRTDPALSFSGLVQGAELGLGQQVHVSYECTDGQSGIESCVGDVPDGDVVDTTTAGAHTFTVTATDRSGRTRTREIAYTVAEDPTARLQVLAAATVEGTGRVGETLTGTSAVFDPAAEVTCRWLRDGVAIEGAEGATYALTAADLGTTITFACTGVLDGYADHTSASAGRAVAAGELADGLVTEPGLTGLGEIGATLTAAYTIADRPAGLTDTVVWLRDDAVIDGATGTTYVVTAADAGHAVRAVVDVTRPGYTDRRYPLGRVPVAEAPAELQVVTAAEIVGSGRVGEVLTGTPAVFEPAATVSCRWLRDGVLIDGAAATYTPVAADLGATIAFECAGSLEGHADTTSVSAGRTVVIGGLADGLVAGGSLTGTGEVGSTLTAAYTIADRPADLTDAVVWLRDGTVIEGVTGPTYVVRVADIGHRVSAVAAVARPGYADRRYPLGEVAGRKIAVRADGALGFTGTSQVGQRLTAAPPAVRPVSGGAPVPTTLQWLRDGAPIAGATGASYLVQPVDLNRRISLRLVSTADAASYDPLAVDAPAGPAVVKAKPVLSVKAKAKKRTVRLTLTVTAGELKPGGKVVVKKGKKVVARGKVRNGTLVLKLKKKQPKGRMTYVVRYAGAPGVAAAKVNLKVRVR